MTGPFHAEAISQLDDAELVGVATTREKTAKPFAERFGVKAWYRNYHELLQRGDIDVVNGNDEVELTEIGQIELTEIYL